MKIVLRPVVGRLFAGAALAGLLTSLAIGQQSSGDGYAGATVSVRFADATDAVGAAGVAFADIVTQSVTATTSASIIFQNAVEEYNSSRSYIVAFGEDDDSDQVPDSRDQCPGTPFEADIDTNGCARIQVDQDLDGVCNAGASSPLWCTGTDICPNTPPGTVVDSSGCPLQSPGDSDGDGVPDSSDNCPLVPNPAQTDSDGDLSGDFCDTDDDNDRILDGLDNCPTVEGEFLFDLDGDGLALGCDPSDGNPDTDGDGLLDSWEVRGYDHDFDGPLSLTHPDGIIDVNLPAMGANPRVPDIFVELDHMGDGSHRDVLPVTSILRVVDRFFSARGIRLHVDAGTESVMIRREPDAPDIRWPTSLGRGGDVLEHVDLLRTSVDGWVEFDRRRRDDPVRKRIFHYVIGAHFIDPGPSFTGRPLGQARPAGRFDPDKDPIGKDFAIAQGEFVPTSVSAKAYLKCKLGVTSEECVVAQAANFMHELGHNLGLRHGGNEDESFKPNYLSVMNYSFSLGLHRRNREFFVDYSSGVVNDLTLGNMNEQEGLSPDSAFGGSVGSVMTRYACPGTTRWQDMIPVRANGPIDWDCDRTFERDTPAPYVACIITQPSDGFCDDLLFPTLRDHDDWVALRFDGGGLIGALNLDQETLDPSPPIEMAIDPLVEGQFADGDEDGIRDVFDNCPAAANPEQGDSDDDGYGDACEPNHAPLANAGVDAIVEADSPTGRLVTIDAAGSTDGDGDPLLFTWEGPFGSASGQMATVVFPLGTHEIRLRVDDNRGGVDIDSVLVTVQDTTSPIVTISVPTNAVYAFGQTAAASYTCMDGGSGSTTCAGPVPTGVNIDTSSLGPKTFTVNAQDNVGNTSSLAVNYAVIAAPTIAAVGVTPTTQQYSDTVTLTATLSPTTLAGQAPARNVTFVIGSQTVGTAPLTAIGGSLQASISNVRLREPLPLETSPTGQMSPGTHTVTAVFGGVNSNFIVTNPTTTLTITKEDARATYTGALFASTACVSCSTATLTLSATVQDISAVPTDPTTDATEGDIRNATVTFQIVETGQMITGVPVGVINSADTRTGTATKNVTVNLGTADAMTLTVRVIVDGYYTSPVEQTVVTVAKPLSSSFIAGGGYLTMIQSAGLYPGQAGSKNNFGFSVKYNKSGTNLKGNINTLVRNNGRVYQIKGNAITSLSTNPAIGTSTFNGKANIQDITDPLNPVSIDGNATLQVTMTDKGEPGKADTIGITLWNKSGGLWFSSNWNGTQTLEQLLAGGNLAIR